jgi:hypothetical protein
MHLEDIDNLYYATGVPFNPEVYSNGSSVQFPPENYGPIFCQIFFQ